MSGMERDRKLLAPALAVLAVFLVLMSMEVPWVRVIVALGFCLIAPGIGWARWLGFKNAGDTWAMATVLSISMTVIVATIMAVSGLWSPLVGFGALLVLSILGIIAARRRAGRRDAGQGSLGQVRIQVQQVTQWETDLVDPAADRQSRPRRT